jgi:GNAT superfamily N-acetyltransferase
LLKESQIKIAGMDDGQKVVQFLKRIAQWMKDNDINQWRYLLSGGDDEEILHAVKKMETYIVLNEDEVIATFTISEDQSEWDHHIFGEDFAQDSLYLHRLAISPELIGTGVGSELLDWIHQNISTDKSFLKLDCVCDNRKLNKFYIENGFEYLGETDHHSKYQKKL